MNTRQMTLTGIFAALTAVGSLIIIPLPFSPVPLTLQLLFTLLAGSLFGKRIGLMSQLVYLMLGAAGLPVFAGGSGGLAALAGPTAGYLYGFVLAGYLAGMGQKKIKNKLFFLMLALLAVYISGTLGLVLITGMGIIRAVTVGVLPFIVGDLLKVILASYLTARISNSLLSTKSN